MKKQWAALLAAVIGFAWQSAAQTICWDFGSGSASNATPASSCAANVSAGPVSQGNNNGVTPLLAAASPSSGYAGASGLFNAGAAARAGALSTNAGGSAYFEFTLTPGAGTVLSVTNMAFGARSTSTGPQAFCARSSVDGYAADLAIGAVPNTSTWVLKNVNMSLVSSVAGDPVTFRIYGYNGAGSPAAGTANWRIDDLTVWAAAVAPGTASPPVIGPVPAQCVRVGQTLSFVLSITPTEGDPVTATNVAASAGVAGVWSLTNGLFIYSPAAADIGGQTFTFTAVDKDGTSAPVAVAVSVLKAQKGAVRMTDSTGSYSQDFNALASAGTDIAWDNAADPLEAWYAFANAAAITTYRTGTGTAASGGLYSFGAAGSADRSLGSLASSGSAYRFGVAFTNETGQAVTNLAVRFTAEQWRAANGATNTLVFDYCVTNTVVPLSLGLWHRVNALCFDAPVVTNASQPVGAIYRSAVMSAGIARPVAPGQVVLLRWSDSDDAGNDHAFGIDDLAVSWAAGAMPDAIPVGSTGASENFDEMGADAAAELPCFWRVETRDDAPRVSGGYASGSDHTMNAIASANFISAGSYNFAASHAGDQAVGGLSSSNAAKSVTVAAKFLNATGKPLRRWKVRYAVEKYRNGTVGSAVRLLASLDGADWTPVGQPSAFAADADENGYAADARPGATVGVERQVVMGAPVSAGGVFYLAWQIAASDGNATADTQALGIDDVCVLPYYSNQTVLLVK